MEQGKYAEACPKLAKSQDIAPNGGTLQNLAKCYEANAQWASAWAVYKGLASRATEAGKPDIAGKAQEDVARLEPKLSTLSVRLAPGADLPNLEVRRDGEPMSRAQLGTAVPIDPGSHVFTAVAPGRNRWSASVTVQVGKRDAELVVPVLDEDPNAPQPGAGNAGKTLRIVGLATVAAGAGLLGTGLAFGAMAKSKDDDLSALRRQGGAWDADQQAKFDDGQRDSTFAKVFVVSGGVVLATGAVLFVLGLTKGSSSTAPATGVRFNVTPGPTATSADLSVVF